MIHRCSKPVPEHQKVRKKWETYSGDEELFDFFGGARQFDEGAVLRVFDGDEDVQLVVEVFPVRFASVLLLLSVRW